MMLSNPPQTHRKKNYTQPIFVLDREEKWISPWMGSTFLLHSILYICWDSEFSHYDQSCSPIYMEGNSWGKLYWSISEAQYTYNSDTSKSQTQRTESELVALLWMFQNLASEYVAPSLLFE